MQTLLSSNLALHCRSIEGPGQTQHVSHIGEQNYASSIKSQHVGVQLRSCVPMQIFVWVPRPIWQFRKDMMKCQPTALGLSNAFTELGFCCSFSDHEDTA